MTRNRICAAVWFGLAFAVVATVSAQSTQPAVTGLNDASPNDSQLPSHAKTLVGKLRSKLDGKKCLVAPFSRSGPSNWRADLHVRGLLLGQLARAGVELMSDDPRAGKNADMEGRRRSQIVGFALRC